MNRLLIAALVASACVSSPGLAPAPAAQTTVKFDFGHRPLPDIPLPNDLATRGDPSSPTGLRVNASLIAPSKLQQRVREKIDQLDGWGAFQPITIPFTGPIDVTSVLKAHRDPHYDLSDDVVYLVNIDRRSPHFKQVHHLDIGNGNYPVVLHDPSNYWKNDPRGDTISLPFEEHEEDINGNGVLDALVNVNGVMVPEDTDADGILDHPNYLPGKTARLGDMSAQADALMTFYDAETNTLILRPMEPLEEKTRYAVIVTRRLLDVNGKPVGSPYPYINHISQTAELEALPEALPAGLQMSDIAFTFAFTTQSESSVFVALRDGLYGHGIQKQLATEFPAEVSKLLPLRDQSTFQNAKNPYVVYSEQWLPALEQIVTALQGTSPSSRAFQATVEGGEYNDFVVMGSYESPQLFDRYDAQGNWLPLDDQSWPPDVDAKPLAKAPRSETIYFTLTVPRKEVSARGQGKPAPVVLLGHGYGGSRFDGLMLSGYLAKFGYATFTIDGPSHGLGLPQIERDAATSLFTGFGLGPMATAVFMNRGYNQDNSPDGSIDSGADFWTSYLFHARDMVRQYTLDLMQGVRVLRTFNGSNHWKFDVTGSGTPGLAGDFDGDGVVDVDGNAPFAMVGGSLGGIMSMIVGALEPQVRIATPISGGGGFSDMGLRTAQGGAIEGFMLRGMGPLYTGTLDSSGHMTVEQIVPNLNSTGDYTIATINDVTFKPWDTMVVENLTNGVRGCGFISPSGTVRASVESDKGDATRISFYSGPQLQPVPGCVLNPGVTPVRVVSTFESQVQFQWDKNGNPNTFAVGSPLVALADGYGLRRAHPDLRNFVGLGQLVLDAADPAVFARHAQLEPLFYPGTGETTGCHMAISTSMGDNSVPANTGAAFGRAAGIIDYLNDDPRYGKPDNQVLIDNGVMEAECNYGRFRNTSGSSVCEDVENFSQGLDMWGSGQPRLDPPVHAGFSQQDKRGGVSVAAFTFPRPEGQHAFDLPGSLTDEALSAASCPAMCDETAPATNTCSCQAKIFDIGWFMLNMYGTYLQSGGTSINTDLCNAYNDCAGFPAVPPARTGAAIDE